MTEDYVTSSGGEGLRAAAQASDEVALRQLLQSGAPVNHQDHSGWTALHWASQLHIVKLLVEAGADVDIVDSTGYSTALWAVYYGYLDILRYLILECNASVTVSDQRDDTMMHVACTHQHGAILKFLAEETLAPLDKRNATGCRPLDVCPKARFMELSAILSNPDVARKREALRLAAASPNVFLEPQCRLKVLLACCNPGDPTVSHFLSHFDGDTTRLDKIGVEIKSCGIGTDYGAVVVDFWRPIGGSGAPTEPFLAGLKAALVLRLAGDGQGGESELEGLARSNRVPQTVLQLHESRLARKQHSPDVFQARSGRREECRAPVCSLVEAAFPGVTCRKASQKRGRRRSESPGRECDDNNGGVVELRTH